MARKNLLAGLTDATGEESAGSVAPYAIRGASKSMIRSVSDLARQADAYLEGEQVVELDPGVIDGSFVSDRLGDNEQEYRELLEAIRERGQDTPVLVRPHPDRDERYMLVFGHRRVRVAKELGRKVRAVVKKIDDATHIVAQGQENSARANLTFVEKARFAKRLEDMGYGRDVICSALASNEAAVSKMISVATRIPASVVEKIGSAPSVGRERWLELSLLLPRLPDRANEVLSNPEINQLESNERFERLYVALKAKGKPAKKTAAIPEAKTWAAADESASATLKRSGKKTTIALSSADGGRFGEWITSNLDSLYEAFKKSEN